AERGKGRSGAACGRAERVRRHVPWRQGALAAPAPPGVRRARHPPRPVQCARRERTTAPRRRDVPRMQRAEDAAHRAALSRGPRSPRYRVPGLRGARGVTKGLLRTRPPIPGLKAADLTHPRVGYMCTSLAPVAAYKRALPARELPAATAAGVDSLVGVYPGCIASCARTRPR